MQATQSLTQFFSAMSFQIQRLRTQVRPPDCVEIGGGAGEVSRSTVSLSLVVAPPLDLTCSEAYNLEDLQLLSDILDFHMLKEKRVPRGRQTGFVVNTFPNDSDTTSFKRQIVRLIGLRRLKARKTQDLNLSSTSVGALSMQKKRMPTCVKTSPDGLSSPNP